MNAIVATIGHNGAPSQHYDAAMNSARLVGNNFGTLNKNMRALVVSLVQAATVEGYSLNGAVIAAKKEMKFDKLDKADYRKATTNFGYANTIVNAWRDLSAEDQAAFLAGKITPSTLADNIKKAEKAEVAAASAEGEAEAQMEARAETVAKGAAPEAAKVAETLDVGKALAIATAYVKSLREQGVQMATEAELLALHALSMEIDGFRGDMAQPAKVIAA